MSREVLELFCACGDVNEVVSKLGFYGAVNDTHFTTKYHFVKFFDHLAWAKDAQVATVFA
jgi:hypothetical protein